MRSFADDLARYGPDADTAPLTFTEARAYCRELAVGHYENFHVATWLLPKRLRPHFHAVYAYCRWSDDLGDEITDPERSLLLLAWWEGELDRCYEGEASHPVFVALRETIATFDIPRGPFADLLSAFRQDQRVLTYDTFDQLRDYCRRSADPVGRLVLHLVERHTPENVAWSDSICTGLQLANHWQDVARDHAIGRCYLPREDRERFGYTDEDLANRVTNDAFRNLMAFQVERARNFLTEGRPLVDRMPGRVRIDIDLFVRGGLRILEKIEAIDYDVWRTRPTVGKGDGFGLVVRAIGRALMPRSQTSAPQRDRAGMEPHP